MVDLADDVASATIVSAWLELFEVGLKRTVNWLRWGLKQMLILEHDFECCQPTAVTDNSDGEPLEVETSTVHCDSKEIQMLDARPTIFEHIDIVMEHKESIYLLDSLNSDFQKVAETHAADRVIPSDANTNHSTGAHHMFGFITTLRKWMFGKRASIQSARKS